MARQSREKPEATKPRLHLASSDGPSGPDLGPPQPIQSAAHHEPKAFPELHVPVPDKDLDVQLPLTPALREQVGQRKEGTEKTWGHLLVDKLLELAVDGNLRAIQEVWTRLEGKPGAPATAEAAPITVSEEFAQILLQNGRNDEDNDDHDDEPNEDDGSDDGPGA